MDIELFSDGKRTCYRVRHRGNAFTGWMDIDRKGGWGGITPYGSTHHGFVPGDTPVADVKRFYDSHFPGACEGQSLAGCPKIARFNSGCQALGDAGDKIACEVAAQIGDGRAVHVPDPKPKPAAKTSIRRSLSSILSRSIDVENRTVDVIIATENPVPVHVEGMGVVPEILLMSGIEHRPRIPLMRDHGKSSADVIGSVRNIRVDGSTLRGRAHFGKTGDREFWNVREGHQTDVSVGALGLQSVLVREGDTRTIGGRVFSGPVKVVTKSLVMECSVVTMGADAASQLVLA